jgi:hypothetical protein
MTADTVSLVSVFIDTISFIVNIGIGIIAIFGVIVAWKQLKNLGEQIRDARLASSMTGALELYNQYKELSSLREAITVTLSSGWDKRSNQEQVEFINSKIIIVDGKERLLKFACIDIANFYEVIGALVSTKVLPYEIAFSFFGGTTIDWWKRLSIWAQDFRERTNDSIVFTNFENMANKFYREKTKKTQTLIK